MKKTTVLIGQNDMLKSHSHAYTRSNQSGPAVYNSGSFPMTYITGQETVITSSTGGNETRPKSITVRYWERVS